MRLVILESPYTGQGRFWFTRLLSRWANIRYARRALRDSLTRGESPIASHLLYTQPEVLSDEIPSERQLGITAGVAWGRVADAFVFYCDRGFSSGMRYSENCAVFHDRKIEYRNILK